MGKEKIYSIFEAVGIEIEYMIVNRDSLSVMPLAERLLTLPDGKVENETGTGGINWSNELVSHVIEFKLEKPEPSLKGLAGKFQEQVGLANTKLEPYNAMLLPGGMHPLMNPATDTVLWPYGDRSIYNAYDRIFGCSGHGWSNLQSVHINLPFNGDDEFARLHSAARIVLPLIPAIAASSPVMEGRITGFSDTRLNVYRFNQAKIPEIAGRIIPEPVFSEAEYREKIFAPMYRAIAPFDAGCILQDEWLNSRGAIARFDRNAIEIRLIDTQECPAADMAVCAFVCCLVKAVAEEKYVSFQAYKNFETGKLAEILFNCIEKGGDAVIDDSGFLQLFGISGSGMKASALLKKVCRAADIDLHDAGISDENYNFILEGNLSSRIVSSLKNKKSIHQIWSNLAECLAGGGFFHGF